MTCCCWDLYSWLPGLGWGMNWLVVTVLTAEEGPPFWGVGDEFCHWLVVLSLQLKKDHLAGGWGMNSVIDWLSSPYSWRRITLLGGGGWILLLIGCPLPTAEEGLLGWGGGHPGPGGDGRVPGVRQEDRSLWGLPAGLLWRRKWGVSVYMQGKATKS